MTYYLKTNNQNKELDIKTQFMISVHIINKILENNNNKCTLDIIYKNINKYAKLNNIYIYYNDKYRNLNTIIKKKYKSVYNFLISIHIYKIENNIIYKRHN
tara:strand:+ start:1190 stop:1492 length:303 start_codon:yes stop_codon:yes gene_type:complete